MSDSEHLARNAGITYQCHVGLNFLSNSFLMNAAMSFSMLYFSIACVATSTREIERSRSAAAVIVRSLTSILLHVVVHVGILDNGFAVSHSKRFEVDECLIKRRRMSMFADTCVVNSPCETKTIMSEVQVNGRSIYARSGGEEEEEKDTKPNIFAYDSIRGKKRRTTFQTASESTG